MMIGRKQLKARKIDLESYWADWSGVGKQTIVQGVDFDECVLAIPAPCHPYLCKEVLPSDTKWQAMIDHLPGAEMYAFQLWAYKSANELGWPVVAKPPSFAIGIAAEKRGVYSDFSDLIAVEGWTGPDNSVGKVPKLCLYVCGPFSSEVPQPPFSDHDYPRRHLEK